MKNTTTMIKSMALGLFAVAGMAFLAASSAKAGDQDFTLVNKTGVEIHSLHVAPHSEDDWGEGADNGDCEGSAGADCACLFDRDDYEDSAADDYGCDGAGALRRSGI